MNTRTDTGLSAVELLVTIVVTTLFIITFNALSVTVSQSSAQNRWRSTANDIAYAKLREYTTPGTIPGDWPFVCNSTSDLVTNSSAAGQVLESGTMPSDEAELPDSINYTVRALAIYGCSGANSGKPIRVESEVIYGLTNTSVRHATFVGYE